MPEKLGCLDRGGEDNARLRALNATPLLNCREQLFKCSSIGEANFEKVRSLSRDGMAFENRRDFLAALDKGRVVRTSFNPDEHEGGDV